MNKKDIYTEAHLKYYPLVYSTVYLKVNNETDAQDICQEIFFAFFEKLDKIENHRKWLYGTLRIEILNFYKRKYSTEVAIDEVFNDVGMTFVNGFRDTRLLIAEVLKDGDIFSGVDDLNIFELIAYNGFSYTTVAKQLGYSKRQIEYKYSKIAAKILDSLKKKGINNIEDLL